MLTDFLYRMRAIFRRSRLDADLEEELRYHLEREAGLSRQGLIDPDPLSLNRR